MVLPGPVSLGPAADYDRGMNTHELEQLASRLLAGELSTQEFAQRLASPTIADLGEAQVDLDRSRRCGFPEVVFAEGKTVAAMEKIFAALLEHGVDVLATRMSAKQAAELGSRFPTRTTTRSAGLSASCGRSGKKAAGTPRRRLPGRWSSSRPARATCPWPKRPGKRPSGPGPGASDPGRGRGRTAPAGGQPASPPRRRRGGGGGGHGRGLAQRGGRTRRLPGDRRAHQRRLRGQFRRHWRRCWGCSTVVRPTSPW